MDEREALAGRYRLMYRGMIQKDAMLLEEVLDDSFVLLHMTGMRQSKRQYIEAILNGTLNYFSEQAEAVNSTIEGNAARLVGQSRVTAAVFGGGKHMWRLQLNMRAVKRDGHWYFTGAEASTY